MADPTGPLAQTLTDQRAAQERLIGNYAEANRVYASYGGIGQDAQVAVPDVDATWQTLTFWDVALLPTPKEVVQDFPLNGLRFTRPGIWDVSVKMELSFVDINSGRAIALRFFNIDDSLPATRVFNFGVGRNLATKTLTFSFILEIDASIINKLIGVQLSSAADTFTGVQALGSTFNAVHVAEEQF